MNVKKFSPFCVLSEMETKRSPYWREYCETMQNFAKDRMKLCVVNAMMGLNYALLDLYELLGKDYTEKEFRMWAGAVIRYVTLIDLLLGNKSDLSYDQETAADPMNKEVLLARAKMMSYLAMQHYPVNYRRSPGHQWRSEFEATQENTQMLVVQLRQILLFIMSRTPMSLRDISTRYLTMLRGREDSD